MSMEEFKASMGFVVPAVKPKSRIEKLQEDYREFTTPRDKKTVYTGAAETKPQIK